MPPPRAGSEAAPAASPVGTPGPVGTGGHRTGSVPNARLCGPLNLRPGGEAAGREGAAHPPPPTPGVGHNLPGDPQLGSQWWRHRRRSERLLRLILFIDVNPETSGGRGGG